MAATDRDFVRQHYPDALAEWVPIRQHGGSGAFARGYWRIFPANREQPSLLGFGEKRDEAWTDAASRLRTNDG